MLARWNECVAADDIVYHLGDFALASHSRYLPRLNGRKRLIVGNHDHIDRMRDATGWAPRLRAGTEVWSRIAA